MSFEVNFLFLFINLMIMKVEGVGFKFDLTGS